MEQGFVKGQSDNLPRIDIFAVIEFFSSNDDGVETSGLFEASRASYRDEAIEYVQIKREDFKCTVKCRVASEHKVKSKPYHCTLVCDENEGKVKSVVCHNCATNQCEHTVAFLIWLYKRSEEYVPVKSYWTKSTISKVGSPKFIKAKDIRNENCTDINITEDSSFLNEFISECKKRKINDIQIMKYFTEPTLEMRASLHYLMCNFKGAVDELNMTEFIQFCKYNITEEQCALIEKATRDEIGNSLLAELQYGRIMASIAHKISECNTPDDVLIEKILGAYQFKAPSALARDKLLAEQVRAQVEKVQQVKIEKCGLLLLKEHPTLGAFPDGVTEEHIIKIKYLDKSKNVTKYIIKQKLTAKYEAQVQLQMYFANKQKALFCMAHEDFETTKQVDVHEFFYDSDYCKKIIDECTLSWKHIFDIMIK